MPKVWNKRDPNCPKDAVYIGRPTQWGNPYVIGRYNLTREDVVRKYREYAITFDKDWFEPLRGRDLVCWCAPKACHGDVLLELANKRTEKPVDAFYTSPATQLPN